jgi:predicted MPP superfamily phosphohydrolase
MLFRFFIVAAILFFVELYALQAFRIIIKTKWIFYAYVVMSALIYGFIFYSVLTFDRKVGQTHQSLYTMGLMVIVYLPKLLVAFLMFGEDVFRILSGVTNYFVSFDHRDTFLPERRKFVSQVALGIAAVPFLSLIYGVTKGKYNFKVIRQTLFFPDLPEQFDGMKITQISDIHSGSFDDPERIKYAIDLINEQESDMLLFTGDIVNAKAEEMHPWIETFNKLKEYKFGKYSILGNHDYGAYLEWNSNDEKIKNFEAIKDLHRQIDFKLLLNENVKIKQGEMQIALVGVENWGKHFDKLGDIDKASQNLAKEDFKIVMSHDPSHWDTIIQDHIKHFQLTLSGHTHGMQFGIEIPGFIKWSLAQYMYKQWAGLYENNGRYIYVNRGFGYHAYPGRVGIWPEITVFELKRAEKVA